VSSLTRLGEGLFSWSRFQPERGYDFNGTALVCDGDDAGVVLLVDPVDLDPEDFDTIDGLGSRFIVIVLNSDHERASVIVAAALDAPIYVSAPDRDQLHVGGVTTFDDGHVFPGGWVAKIQSDMKTPGETVLYHAERGVLVVGDAVISHPTEGLRLVPPAKLTDSEKTMAALRALLDLNFETILVGDGRHILHGAHDALSAFVG
jgi:hypothetical protein